MLTPGLNSLVELGDGLLCGTGLEINVTTRHDNSIVMSLCFHLEAKIIDFTIVFHWVNDENDF